MSIPSARGSPRARHGTHIDKSHTALVAYSGMVGRREFIKGSYLSTQRPDLTLRPILFHRVPSH